MVLPLLSGCAGYQIGDKGLHPQGIRTVYVPIFQSNSFRRNLGERLTEAVVKQIEKETTYKVVADPNADSVLTGCIVAESKTVLVPELSGNARESQVAMTVKVSWVDRRGLALRDEKTIAMPSELVDVTGTANVVPEVGQSIATAQQQAIVRLAKEIVNLMENPW
ncbi:MAG: LptE family protein [Thermoguttaceae bacterium]